MNQFEHAIDRRQTQSVKWDLMNKIYDIPEELANEILPFWVADMDFPVPNAVIEAIQKRLQHPVFGYTFQSEDLTESIVNWMKKRHDWTIDKDWVIYDHGVIPAVATTIEVLTEKSDTIIVSGPVYPPLFSIPTQLGRTVKRVELKIQDEQYTFDFDALEAAFKEGVKAFILCHPHNPGGRSWKKEELSQLVSLAKQYDVLLFSDEIHSDLLLWGNEHYPLAKVAENEKNRVITFAAPTKTFNLAATQAAYMLVSDPEMREKIQKHNQMHGVMFLNVFAQEAMKAAYTHGEQWLQDAKATIEANMEKVMTTLSNEVPKVKAPKPDATYLMWLDYRELNVEEKEMMHALLHDGKVALEPGSKYGEEGVGFLRMNVACSPETLDEGLKRVVEVFKRFA